MYCKIHVLYTCMWALHLHSIDRVIFSWARCPSTWIIYCSYVIKQIVLIETCDAIGRKVYFLHIYLAKTSIFIPYCRILCHHFSHLKSWAGPHTGTKWIRIGTFAKSIRYIDFVAIHISSLWPIVNRPWPVEPLKLYLPLYTGKGNTPPQKKKKKKKDYLRPSSVDAKLVSTWRLSEFQNSLAQVS